MRKRSIQRWRDSKRRSELAKDRGYRLFRRNAFSTAQWLLENGPEAFLALPSSKQQGIVVLLRLASQVEDETSLRPFEKLLTALQIELGQRGLVLPENSGESHHANALNDVYQ